VDIDTLPARFIGKFYIVKGGIGSSLWLLVAMLVINSAMGLFYYLRVVIALFGRPASNVDIEDPIASAKISLADSISLAVLTILLL
jgi:NADH-quinone oxidoreductase subunit N